MRICGKIRICITGQPMKKNLKRIPITIISGSLNNLLILDYVERNLTKQSLGNIGRDCILILHEEDF